ncbi:MAG TPA: HEAT repeat domain-containing protein [Pyrinomonadaceae bacterium]|nr:HEAT repeat domain-containing protein [Pyrinomonadaceae bacterium]
MDSDSDRQNLIGIFTTDTKFIVQVWDAALEKMTGISADGARGKAVVETIPGLETRGLLARFTRVLEEGTVEILAPAFHRFLISCPPQFPSKRFKEMRQRVTIAPLKENETICGLIVTIEDVTARMERETELTEQLKNSDETVRLRAAKEISEQPENLVEENAAPIIEALGDKNWRVRRELVESLSRRSAPEAIAALLRAMQQRHFDFAVLNSALQVLRATSVKTTETLVEFLRGDDADLRMQAALTLGEQKDAQAIPALLAALEDENANVRYHAIEALGKLKAGEAVEPLLKIAETRDFFLSFAALDALRQTVDETAAPRVLPLLGDDFLREAAIQTLGAIGNEEIVAPLISLLNEDKFSAIAVAAALAALFHRFRDDAAKSESIVERARKSIDEGGKSNLLKALNNSNETDLKALVRIGGWFDDEQIREKLAELIENENVRDEAARALARQGEAAVDLLIEKLRADDAEVCLTAARALGELKSERAFEPLIDLLETGDAAARQAAVGALKSLAHPETLSRLGDLLADTDSGIREAAIRVVGYFGAKGCEQAVFQCCEDADERVRRAAIEQLPFIEDERAVSTLIRILKQGLPRERETAAKALAQVESEESVAALRAALSDADAWVRYFAVRALGVLQDAAASRSLLIELAEKDSAQQVRAAAREVLNELKA